MTTLWKHGDGYDNVNVFGLGGIDLLHRCWKQLPQFYNAQCKCSQHNQRKKRAANRKKHLQIKKTTFVILTMHTLQMLKTQPKKKRAANKMYLVVLWAFAVCFFICLYGEHLHHLLSNWWKYFLDLLVLFLFACVFWSCIALSSLSHRMLDLYFEFTLH